MLKIDSEKGLDHSHRRVDSEEEINLESQRKLIDTNRKQSLKRAKT